MYMTSEKYIFDNKNDYICDIEISLFSIFHY